MYTIDIEKYGNRMRYLRDSIDDSWFEHIAPFLCSEEGDKLINMLIEEHKKYTVYPAKENRLRVFKRPINDIKVVILGQDPYHGPGQATGLAFGVSEETPIPPSLKNIIKEVKRTEGDGNFDKTLTKWEEQGVFLINTALTVRRSQANSHKNIWKSFINFVFSTLNYERSNLIYLLWGNNAKSYKKLIGNHNYILESPHPSPLAKGFVGNDHFSKTNKILIKDGKVPIQWI